MAEPEEIAVALRNEFLRAAPRHSLGSAASASRARATRRLPMFTSPKQQVARMPTSGRPPTTTSQRDARGRHPVRPEQNPRHDREGQGGMLTEEDAGEKSEDGRTCVER